jgi:hypothetical protein
MLINPKYRGQETPPEAKPETQYIIFGDDHQGSFFQDGFEQLMEAMRLRNRVNRVLGSKPRQR